VLTDLVRELGSQVLRRPVGDALRERLEGRARRRLGLAA
jgi:hypothetical protein